MGVYLQLLRGPSALDAVPILVSAEERIVDAALRAVALESRRIVEEEAEQAEVGGAPARSPTSLRIT